MSTSADFGRLSIYFCPLQPKSADFQSTTADCCLLLPSSADFCRLLSTCADPEPVHALHRYRMVLYGQQREKKCQCKKTTATAWTNESGPSPREKPRLFDLFFPE